VVFRSNQAKGAQKVDGSAPLLPLPRNPGISNSDDEIAAGLGREPPGAGGVSPHPPHYKTLSHRMRRQGLFLWTWEFTTAQCRITISAPNLAKSRAIN
jgi:hypothetical protein